MIVLYCFIVASLTAIAITAIVMRLGTTSESEVLRSAYRKLETETRTAQEQSVLGLHNLQMLREQLSEQHDRDLARLSRCEVQAEANERNMVALGKQFKDAIIDVKQESGKLSMLVTSATNQRKGF